MKKITMKGDQSEVPGVSDGRAIHNNRGQMVEMTNARSRLDDASYPISNDSIASYPMDPNREEVPSLDNQCHLTWLPKSQIR